jgi:hypothetical protein
MAPRNTGNDDVHREIRLGSRGGFGAQTKGSETIPNIFVYSSHGTMISGSGGLKVLSDRDRL